MTNKMSWKRESDRIPILLTHTMKGGALYYALFVMLVLGLIGTMLLGYVELVHRQDAFWTEEAKLEDDLNSAMELLCSTPETVQPGESKTLDLFDDGQNLVDVECQWWGVMRKGTFTAKGLHQQRKKAILFAEREKKRFALWMPERNRYVSLVGKSWINGDCCISGIGLRKGNAEGRYFEGPWLHKGSLTQSPQKMIQPTSGFLSAMASYLNGSLSANDTLANFLPHAAIVRSFHQTTLVLHRRSSIHLTNESYGGNIIIRSSDSIVVGKGANLLDILLVSKKVRIDDGFEGRIQILADSLILVGKNCNLLYPSFLVAIGKGHEAAIRLGGKSKLYGGVLTFSGEWETEGRENLSIEKDAHVFGKAYVDGETSISGNVTGSLYTQNFIFQTARSFYENFLIDCVIDGSGLPEGFASFCLEGELDRLRMVKILQ